MAGIDINLGDANKRTPLHHAAAKGQFIAVKLLCEHGFQHFNPVDKYGKTPLDDADKLGKQDIITLLLRKGAKYKKV